MEKYRAINTTNKAVLKGTLSQAEKLPFIP